MFICEGHRDLWDRDTGCPYCREFSQQVGTRMLEEAIRQLSGDKERAVSMNCELLSENKALREAARAALKKQAGSEEHARLAALLENQPN